MSTKKKFQRKHAGEPPAKKTARIPPAMRRTKPAMDAGLHPDQPGKATFPIVGIGASAGGLEALEQFLERVPAGSGIAFVIVQHLDPTHECIMPELLALGVTMSLPKPCGPRELLEAVQGALAG